MIVLPACDGVGIGVVGFDIVAFHLFQDFVGAAGLLIFDIEHRIDEMLTLEEAETVLPAEAGEDGAVVEGGLAVEIKFGGPPGSGAVFELSPKGMKVVAGALGAESGEVFDFEAARLFEIVVIGDDVGTFLRARRKSDCSQEQRQQAEEKNGTNKVSSGASGTGPSEFSLRIDWVQAEITFLSDKSAGARASNALPDANRSQVIAGQMAYRQARHTLSLNYSGELRLPLVATESHLSYSNDLAGRSPPASRIGGRNRRRLIATSCDNGAYRMPLPQTEMPGRLQAHLAERGIRMTQQRRAILMVMETASKHLDASQILRKAKRIDASVDRSTVYRTLRLLKRQGLIDELDLMHINGEGHYYERKLERDHIHMACLRCGKITEFVSDSFEKLKQQVEKDCRFRVVVSRLEIGGYCAGCRRSH